MAGGDLDLRRRSLRLIKMKAANASLEDRILKLKREGKALWARRKERWAREDRDRKAAAADALEDRDRKGAEEEEEAQPAGAAEEAQPAGTSKKRKKVVVVKRIVPQGLIDYMILNPANPFYDLREDKLGKRSKRFLEKYAELKAISDNMIEYQQVIIKQFRAKGFAEDYEEVEVDDDEEEGCTEEAEEGCTEEAEEGYN